MYQILAVVLIGGAVWFLAHNTAENMRIRGIKSGFDFLSAPAGFDIGESLFPFDSNDPYWKAFLIGITNTLRVAVVGIILTTILGTMIGLQLHCEGAAIVAKCLERGLLINCTHGTVIRLLPAVNIPDELIDDGCAILAEVLMEHRP